MKLLSSGRCITRSGLRSFAPMTTPDELLSISLPGLHVGLPFGFEPFVDAFTEALPSEADSIRDFWLTAAQVERDVHGLAQRLAGLSVETVARQLLPDWRAQALCGAVAFAFGAPPSRMPFVTFSQRVIGHVEQGTACVDAHAGASVVFGASALDLERAGVGHMTLHFDSWDTEDAYRRTLVGDVGYTLLWAPSLDDASGDRVVVAITPTYGDAPRPARLWRHLDRLVPGLVSRGPLSAVA